MFQVTSSAARQIRDAADRSSATGMALRIAARQIADGSVEYGMGFDAVHDGDSPIEIDGVTVVVAPPCQPLLEATVLDWVELEPGTFAFIFIPPTADSSRDAPNAGRTCGSGGCAGCSSGRVDQ
jgi:iron-sulfur cluster assembly protein